VGRIAREHNDAICASLNPAQREELARLLRMIADDQGLIPGVHPGYGRMGAAPRVPSHTHKEDPS